MLVLLWSCSLRDSRSLRQPEQSDEFLTPPSVHRLPSVPSLQKKVRATGERAVRCRAVPCICHLTPPKPDIPRRLVSSPLSCRLCADVQILPCFALPSSSTLSSAQLISAQLWPEPRTAKANATQTTCASEPPRQNCLDGRTAPLGLSCQSFHPILTTCHVCRPPFSQHMHRNAKRQNLDLLEGQPSFFLSKSYILFACRRQTKAVSFFSHPIVSSTI